MKSLCKDAQLIHAFMKCEESAPQFKQFATEHVEWYLAPQLGHPTIPVKIGCRQEKHGITAV